MPKKPVYQPLRPNDLALMKDVKAWPCWPLLPIKNKRIFNSHGMPRIAILMGGDDWWKVAYDENLFQIAGRMRENKVTWVEVKPEELVREGWIVD